MTTENGIIIYTTSWCSDCHRAKHFLDEYGFDYKEIDIEEDAEGMAFVRAVNKGRCIIPTIVFANGTLLVEPSTQTLAQNLNVELQHDL